MRDVNYGWMIRYMHANVASFFFIFVYLHIGRNLYYGSYKSPRVLVFSIGVVMLILIIGIAFLGYIISLKCYSRMQNLCLTLVPVAIASPKLQVILNKHKLSPEHIFEYNKSDNFNTIDNKQQLSNKKLLNSLAGVYICINKSNGRMYVGSAGFKLMYRRFRAHLFFAKGGSILVNKAVIKYGLVNFAFLVIKKVDVNLVSMKTDLIAREQHYIDTLLPEYNIAKIAYSVLGIKRTIQQRNNMRLSITEKQIQRIRQLNLGKTFSLETR